MVSCPKKKNNGGAKERKSAGITRTLNPKLARGNWNCKKAKNCIVAAFPILSKTHWRLAMWI